jgi:hypothetical protein
LLTKKQLSSRRGFLKTMGGVGAAAGGMRLGLGNSLGGAPVAPKAGRPSGNIFVGSRRQLLFDDFFVGPGNNFHESIPYGIRWSLGKVQKSPAGNIFKVQEPWHDRTAWFNVLYEDGRYRMWYAGGKVGRHGMFVCYAESDDGIEWRKPILNLIERDGSKQNNIVYAGGPAPGVGVGVELGNVFRDPVGKPDERYKMIYPSWEGNPSEEGVTMGATSPDGLHWTRTHGFFLPRYCDTQNVAMYDPVLQKYVAYVRWNSAALYGELNAGEHPVRGLSRGRSVARMESDDYAQWSTPEVVLAPDFEDGLNVQFYGSSYSQYTEADNAHFMFPAGYHVREGTFLVQVAVSRDNRTWVRPNRETYIPLGPAGSFDDHAVAVAPGFLSAGKDQCALYYRAGNIAHPGALHEFLPKSTSGEAGVGRVVFKRDRIVGIESGPEGGAFWTRPLMFEGKTLVVNVEPTGSDAQLQVQLVGVGTGSSTPTWARGEGMNDAPCPGYTFDENIPVTSDDLDATVRWKERSSVGEWAGKPVRLYFRLRSMRIYAFQFVS